MDIKLVAIDMDGTFLSEDCSVSQRNIEAVRKCVDKGILIVPTTGRSFWNVKHHIFDGFDRLPYSITANGTIVADMKKEQILYQEAMPDDIAAEIYALTKEYRAYIEIYAGLHAYIDRQGMDSLYESGIERNFCDQIMATNVELGNLEELILDEKIPISKFHILCMNVDEKAKLKEEINNLEHLYPISVIPKNIELNYGHWSKRDGLEKLTEKLGIDRSQVMAIGDSNNDYEMMSWAGCSVAMGNAVEKVKKVSRYVTDSNNEDGVAAALEKFLDI